MREDRLRALRALRFSARFGFEIENKTWTAIEESAPHLGRLSAERVKQEIEKTMEQVRAPSSAFNLWKKSGAFGTLIPSLARIDEIDLATIDYLAQPSIAGRPQRRMMRLIALFAAAPSAEVPGILKALRFSNSDAAWIGSILSSWTTLKDEMRTEMLTPEGPSNGAIRKWAAVASRTRLASVLRLGRARWCAEHAAGMESPQLHSVASVYRRAIRIAYNDPIEVSDLAVNGRDLEKLGLTGPLVGKTLRWLLDLVINDPGMNSREKLLARARERQAGL
jgi:tRNA nucleotidyltransferase (CCA-adding enzyme)